jgi:hypothetical protein
LCQTPVRQASRAGGGFASSPPLARLGWIAVRRRMGWSRRHGRRFRAAEKWSSRRQVWLRRGAGVRHATDAAAGIAELPGNRLGFSHCARNGQAANVGDAYATHPIKSPAPHQCRPTATATRWISHIANLVRGLGGLLSDLSNGCAPPSPTAIAWLGSLGRVTAGSAWTVSGWSANARQKFRYWTLYWTAAGNCVRGAKPRAGVGIMRAGRGLGSVAAAVG